ncbi:hypothetical protein LZC95_19835 [Pendulispora brunnea]|uniref:Uncharacterized protein n=1 Tax=Pendulispora brunnea TaxID=2905690 RepID=A0ABZ2KK73_9BACT
MQGSIVQLRDEHDRATGRRLELATGRVLDPNGSVVAEYEYQNDVALSEYAAFQYHQGLARTVRHPVRMRAADGNSMLVTMDLAVTDVHQDAPLPNYAAGYRQEDGVADIACPVVLVPKPSDKYYTWNASNAFARVMPNVQSAGTGIPEVSPTLSLGSFTTIEYALASFVPTELEAAADAPLRPFQAAVNRVMAAMKIEREFRVASLMSNPANFVTPNVITLAPGAQWNGGPNSDPIGNLQTIIENSFAPITGIVMSRRLRNAFARNPQVQKYFSYKDSAAAIPSNQQLSAILDLPPIYTAEMKYAPPTGNPIYVWGPDVVLFHHPPANPPADGQDVSTAYTFRWTGANGVITDGQYVSGWMVRTYWDARRGARGGKSVVVVVQDAEVATSSLVGGVIKNAYQ